MAAALTSALTVAFAQPTPPPTLLLAGRTDAYLEPCGCGGQMAGGLARRAQMIADERAAHPGAVVIDIGGCGTQADTKPVVARVLAHLGLAAMGLGPDDLLDPTPWRELPTCSLTPAQAGQAVPSSRVVESNGLRLGVLSVAFGPLTTSELALSAVEQTARLRGQGCALTLLISHLGPTGTERLLAKLPEAQRPRLVALATDDNEPAPAYDKLGATWVPVAQRGRSLSRVTLTAERDLWRAEVAQQLILEGPRDAQVQGWVDAYYAALKTQATAADASFARPAQCLPCHEPVVKAWRGHAHAQAVAMLEQANRAVPECLACHDEQSRRGVGRAADGGVECASCHDKLAEHMADGRKTASLPCGRCHTPEHSPRFDEARYRALVRAVCGAR